MPVFHGWSLQPGVGDGSSMAAASAAISIPRSRRHGGAAAEQLTRMRRFRFAARAARAIGSTPSGIRPRRVHGEPTRRAAKAPTRRWLRRPVANAVAWNGPAFRRGPHGGHAGRTQHLVQRPGVVGVVVGRTTIKRSRSIPSRGPRRIKPSPAVHDHERSALAGSLARRAAPTCRPRRLARRRSTPRASRDENPRRATNHRAPASRSTPRPRPPLADALDLPNPLGQLPNHLTNCARRDGPRHERSPDDFPSLRCSVYMYSTSMALSSKFRLCKKGAVCPEKPFGRKFDAEPSPSSLLKPSRERKVSCD